MPLGYCTLQLRLPGNGSLKAKRRLLSSVIQRVGSRFNVSVAEIGSHDSWKAAILGIACVSNSGAHCHEMLERVVNFVETSRLDAELLDYSIEIVHP